MFVLSQQGNALQQSVAMVVAGALVLWSFGIHTAAQAANLTDVKNTLSDSDVSALSDHEIQYVIPAGSAGVEAGETIVVTFPAGFDLATNAIDETDIDLTIGVTPQVLAAAPSGATWGAVVSGQDITFTSGTGVAAALATVTIAVGENATGGVANDQVINPTAGSHEFVIVSGSAGGVGGSDTGKTRVVVLENVVVTAIVDTVFDFTVTGETAIGTNANGTTTTATSSATEIPFGTLTVGDIETIAQQLNVTTNAIQGFVVTVEQDQNLLSSTGADIDGFVDGSYEDTPALWASPDGTLGFGENGWGHWGLTSEDTDLVGAGTDFTSNRWVAASTTPRAIFAHDGVSDGIAAGIGSTTVAYQIEISSLQEAADDYTTTLTYIATPTF